MNAIERNGKEELAWNGRRIKNSEEEVIRALAPMFAAYSSAKVTDEMVDVYVRMLRDVAPHRLAEAVDGAMNSCKYLPTIADIREQLELRTPGPRSDVDPHTLPDIPMNMYRLPPDEDYEQRMERLRMTRRPGDRI